MPKTIFGIGAKEYGARDVKPDGSMVRTKFYVVFHIPIWPVDTRRVRYQIESHAHPRIVRRYVLEQSPVLWRQAIGFLAAGWTVCLGILFGLALALTRILAN